MEYSKSEQVYHVKLNLVEKTFELQQRLVANNEALERKAWEAMLLNSTLVGLYFSILSISSVNNVDEWVVFLLILILGAYLCLTVAVIAAVWPRTNKNIPAGGDGEISKKAFLERYINTDHPIDFYSDQILTDLAGMVEDDEQGIVTPGTLQNELAINKIKASCVKIAMFCIPITVVLITLSSLFIITSR